MTETLQSNGLWHVSLIIEDLIAQAEIPQSDLEFDLGCFLYKGRRVITSHSFGEHLVASIDGQEDEDFQNLIRGYSKIVGYDPFCKYSLLIERGASRRTLPTYEWDKKDKEGRFNELSGKGNVRNLVRI